MAGGRGDGVASRAGTKIGAGAGSKIDKTGAAASVAIFEAIAFDSR
jgi:hypothetical protein